MTIIVSDACTVNIINDTSRIIIDDSTVMLQIVASLTDNSGGFINDCNMFIVESTVHCLLRRIVSYDRPKKSFINSRQFCLNFDRVLGTYFNCIMMMVASSVVLTVVVLNYHHRHQWHKTFTAVIY